MILSARAGSNSLGMRVLKTSSGRASSTGALAGRAGQRFLFPVYHYPAYGTTKGPPGKLPIDTPRAIELFAKNASSPSVRSSGKSTHGRIL